MSTSTPDDNADDVHDRGHRAAIGGIWEQVGKLQFDFLLQQGLKPSDVVLDIACGSLRAGVWLIPYLDAGNYLGLDKRIELLIYGVGGELGLELYRKKRPRFVVSDTFDFTKFDERPRYAIAQSLFTHLSANDIALCLHNLRKYTSSDCKFYATFRQVANDYRNPAASHAHARFGYTTEQMAGIAMATGWQFEYIGEWGHPRQQKMVMFR